MKDNNIEIIIHIFSNTRLYKINNLDYLKVIYESLILFPNIMINIVNIAVDNSYNFFRHIW